MFKSIFNLFLRVSCGPGNGPSLDDTWVYKKIIDPLLVQTILSKDFGFITPIIHLIVQFAVIYGIAWCLSEVLFFLSNFFKRNEE